MRVINAVNVNDAWASAKLLLNQIHVTRPSRVGEVWEYPTPVTTIYQLPLQRVLFDPVRNANPVFHLMEALHMLAGRQDVSWLERFNSQIRQFVGVEELQHDAYGYRLRYAFDMDGGGEDGEADQLAKVIRMLRRSPDERRAVLANWAAHWDLERPELPSVPCNTHAYLNIRHGLLDITVCCRSNDIIFGCYGSNVVQFSVLLEYLAAMIGVPVGVYYQISNSFHAYTERWVRYGGTLTANPTVDYYSDAAPGSVVIEPYPLVADPTTFDTELREWMARETITRPGWRNPFFLEVAEPLWQAWDAYKEDRLEKALLCTRHCKALDWRIATMEWLERIAAKRQIRRTKHAVPEETPQSEL